MLGAKILIIKNIKGIIFDFDGVIAESVLIKTDAFAELYLEYGDEVVKKVVEHHESHGGVSRYDKIKYYHNNFLNIKIDDNELLRIASIFSKIVTKKVINVPYVPGVLNYLNQNYNKYKLFISTATPTQEIILILKKRNIIHYFDAVYGSPDTKIIHVENIMNKYSLNNNELIFIGDSQSDAECANYYKINFILRKHNYHSYNFKTEHYKIIKDFTSPKILNFL